MNDLAHFLSIQNELSETPIWVPEEKLLYWVDFIRNTIFRIDVKTKMYESFIPLAGDLFRIQTDIVGIAEPVFEG